ncbi:MAG: PAS domain-containing sensor histidine kinase, partial [Candidatus Electrothrix sp. AR3]|nr:PAS domain-containing sensor histidine kinase [Candidatus Electrothrix sp. AR3]
GKVLVAVHNDITVRKQAEEQLKQSEERFKSLFDNMLEGVAIYEATEGGEDFIFKDINKYGALLSGRTREDVVGYSLLDTFPGVKNFGLFDVFQRVWKTGQFEHHPIARYQDDRVTHWVENFVFKIFSGEIVAVYKDETARKQAEQKTKESEERLNFFLSSTFEGIFIHDKGVILDSNEQAAKIWGYDLADFIGMNTFDHMSNTSQQKIKKEAVEKTTALYEVEIIRKDGTSVIVETNGNEVEYKGKTVRVVVFRDITRRKKMEQEMLKLKKLEATATLAGGIAHDYNNLLAVIIGYIDLTRIKYKDPKLDQALEASWRAQELTNKFITFSSGGSPKKKKASMKEIISESIAAVLSSPTYPAELVIADNLWQVEMDSGQMSQVFKNMLLNAKEAMDERGTIKIRLENISSLLDEDILAAPITDKQFVKIVITDQGIGMSDMIKQNIFDPYFSTKQRGIQKGMGLGLTVAFSIIKEHEGYLVIKSKKKR